VWKQRVHASLGLRRIEDKLCFSVFLQNRIVVIHRHRAVRISVRCRPDLEHGEVQPIHQGRGRQHSKDCGDQYSSQPRPEVGRCGLSHGPDYKLSPATKDRPVLGGLAGTESFMIDSIGTTN
jgi:hypothetical protein